MKKNLCRAKNVLLCVDFLLVILFSVPLRAVNENGNNVDVITATSKHNADVFVAVDTRVDNVFDALSIKLGKAIITSPEVKKRKVTGDFNMANPEKILTQLTNNMALNWFNDGQSLYIFANTELKNEIIQLRFAPYQELISYLKATSLYDSRYPTRAKPDAGSFYVSGPPIYVDLVKAAAKYLDETYMQEDEYGVQNIRVIRLKNTFVNDRAYAMRGDLINVPGVASAINNLLDNRKQLQVQLSNNTEEDVKENNDDSYIDMPYAKRGESNRKKIFENSELSIVAHRDTNSLLIKGSASQVRYIEQLINTLDVAKQQIELSVWVIDIVKSQFSNLGVRWQANFTSGNAAVRFNSSELDVINGAKFLANVSALSTKGDAQVVSRPIILTQENVPAVFDNNTTFYTKLIGEKHSSLKDVTYGTLVSVLPRVSFKEKEIEMVINIEDGNLKYRNDSSRPEEVDNLPMVGRTMINTVARVPRDSSLLIGGYTREQNENKELKIPILGDIPLLGILFRYKMGKKEQMVRIFLIQPKLLSATEEWNGSTIQEDPMLSSNMKLRQTVNMLQNYVSR